MPPLTISIPWVAALLLAASPTSSYIVFEDLTSRSSDEVAGNITRVHSPILDDPEHAIHVEGWSNEVATPAFPVSRRIAKNMTLCVPLIPEDSMMLLGRFVRQLNNQTVKPSELVVAVSSATEELAAELQSRLREVVDDIPVFVTGVSHKANAAENRNRCVKHSHGEIITFFDSDDPMHPRRTEILNYVFQQYHPKAILHKFATMSESIEERSINPKFECVKTQTASYQDKDTFNASKDDTIAQGWVTVSRDVFGLTQFNESRREGEDVQFLEDIMRAYPNSSTESTLLYVKLDLGSYMPRLIRKINEVRKMGSAILHELTTRLVLDVKRRAVEDPGGLREHVREPMRRAREKLDRAGLQHFAPTVRGPAKGLFSGRVSKLPGFGKPVFGPFPEGPLRQQPAAAGPLTTTSLALAKVRGLAMKRR